MISGWGIPTSANIMTAVMAIPTNNALNENDTCLLRQFQTQKRLDFQQVIM